MLRNALGNRVIKRRWRKRGLMSKGGDRKREERVRETGRRGEEF